MKQNIGIVGLGLIGEEVGGSFKTYHFDYRGSTVAVTSENGSITDTFAYDTYGKQTARTGESDIIFGYNGKYGVITEPNGLVYMRARYYSPELRRFINADVIAGEISNAITLNRYAYANGNPVSNIDPFGLSAERENKEQRIEYINSHFKEEITLEQVAKEACLSKSYITSAFKKIMNRTIFEYIDYDFDFDEDIIEKYNVGTTLPVLIILDNDKEVNIYEQTNLALQIAREAYTVAYNIQFSLQKINQLLGGDPYALCRIENKIQEILKDVNNKEIAKDEYGIPILTEDGQYTFIKVE